MTLGLPGRYLAALVTVVTLCFLGLLYHRATQGDTVVQREFVGLPTKNNTRICTQSERIAHVASICSRLSSQEAHPPISWVNTYVDNNHRLNFCWMSKAGCTAIKAVIFEANGLKFKVNDPSEALERAHIHQIVGSNHYRHLKVDLLSSLSPDKKTDVLRDYTNMLAVRHPFSRLYSYYKDKLQSRKDPLSAHIDRQRNINKFVHPYSPTRVSSPSFQEFLYWGYKTRVRDDHWARIVPTCDACGRHWDAVLRVETMDTDARILMKQLNLTADRMPLVHSHNPNLSHSEFDILVSGFQGVPKEVVDYWLEYFKTDMEMFGYGWDGDTLTATCSIPTADGGFCC